MQRPSDKIPNDLKRKRSFWSRIKGKVYKLLKHFYIWFSLGLAVSGPIFARLIANKVNAPKKQFMKPIFTFSPFHYSDSHLNNVLNQISIDTMLMGVILLVVPLMSWISRVSDNEDITMHRMYIGIKVFGFFVALLATLKMLSNYGQVSTYTGLTFLLLSIAALSSYAMYFSFYGLLKIYTWVFDAKSGESTTRLSIVLTAVIPIIGWLITNALK